MADDFDDLDRETLAAIGDLVSYQPGGDAAITPPFTAWVDHADMDVGFGGIAAVVGDASLQVRVIDVPQPTKTDIIGLPRVGRFYRPTEYKLDRSGRYWTMTLKQIPQ